MLALIYMLIGVVICFICPVPKGAGFIERWAANTAIVAAWPIYLFTRRKGA